jgi:predicted small lipoprotein YifL
VNRLALLLALTLALSACGLKGPLYLPQPKAPAAAPAPDNTDTKEKK